jgi:hypothetical protein
MVDYQGFRLLWAAFSDRFQRPTDPKEWFVGFIELVVFVGLPPGSSPKPLYCLWLAANSYPPTLVSPLNPQTLFLTNAVYLLFVLSKASCLPLATIRP